jgi:hypothetical protein
VGEQQYKINDRHTERTGAFGRRESKSTVAVSQDTATLQKAELACKLACVSKKSVQKNLEAGRLSQRNHRCNSVVKLLRSELNKLNKSSQIF